MFEPDKCNSQLYAKENYKLFFIGKRVLLQTKSNCIKHALKEKITMEKHNYQKLMILKKSPSEEDEVSPQTRDQSNKEPKKSSIILPTKLSIFLKVRLFLSSHIVHIKQEGTKFHTPEEVLPNQFHHPKISSIIDKIYMYLSGLKTQYLTLHLIMVGRGGVI